MAVENDEPRTRSAFSFAFSGEAVRFTVHHLLFTDEAHGF